MGMTRRGVAEDETGMVSTFTDTFRPTQQAATAGFSGPVGQVMTPRGQSFDTRHMTTATEQVKHFRLWNYVAVDRNATKASEYVPNVSVLRRRPSGAQRSLTKAQRQHIREYYGDMLRNNVDDLEPAPDDHPLVELLRAPNPVDWWSTFAYETYMMVGLTGAFTWWVIPNRIKTPSSPQGLPAEMWNIPTNWAKPIYDERTGELKKWEIVPNGDRRRAVELPPEEVVQCKKPHPTDKTRPFSPLEAGAEWTLNSEAIEKARHLTYKHGNLQTLLLELDPQHYNKPEPETLEEVGNKFMARYGGADKVTKPITMPPGITPHPFSIEPNKMILNEVSEQIRDFVLALHGTPRAVAGIAHDLNKASIFGANLIWCQHTIMPLQAFVAGCMNKMLAPRFDERLRVWYEDCRPHDAEEERAETELDWKIGALKPDERRQERGRDELGTSAGDKTYVPGSVVPLEDFNASLDGGTGNGRGSERDGQQGQSQGVQRASLPGSQQGGCPACGEHQGGDTGHAAVHQGQRERRLSRQFNRLADRLERNAVNQLKRMWSRMKRSAMNRFEEGSTDRSTPKADELIPPPEFRDAFNRTMMPRWKEMLIEGAEFEADVLDIDLQQRVQRQQLEDEPPDINVDFPEELKAKMQDFLQERQVGVWKMVMETVHEDLEAAIAAGLNEGEDIRDIAKRVEDALDVGRDRAIVTARTEATASLNFGQQSVRDVENIGRKQWISTLDSRTRGSHLSADGQVVDNDKPFTVGGHKLMHPGDISLGAPPDEVVQCRCTATGVAR